MARRSLVLVSILITAAGAQVPQPAPPQRTVDAELRLVVEQFAKAVDNGDMAAIAAAYSPDFLNVRIADDGGFVRLTRAQILQLLKPPAAGGVAGVQSIPTRETVIHHVEVIGDMGLVLITRVKDLGSGWEPMYYSLVWRKRDGKWELLREFVHQRSLPRRR